MKTIFSIPIRSTILFFICLLLGSFGFAQNYDLAWAKAFGSTETDAAYSCVVDGDGNVITTGSFTGTVDFDPGPGTTNLTAVFGNIDIFIQKLSPAGNLLWALRIGGVSYDYAFELALSSAGEVYVTGTFGETVDFNPGAGIFNLTAASIYMANDMFILKLDANGTFLWAKSIGAEHVETPRAILVDSTGNLLTTGSFSGNVDFDPGTGSSYLTSSGLEDIFIQKLDANGNFISATRMGGTGNDRATGLALDTSGNICLTGQFASTVDFDPGIGTNDITSPGGFAAFILKLDANINFLWVRSLGVAGHVIMHNIEVDNSGNIYTGGYFLSTVDFDPGAGTNSITSTGSDDAFIHKLDASGNFIWVKTCGGTGADRISSFKLDDMGNIYSIGEFQYTADLDPGTGSDSLTSTGSYVDMFIQRLDADGDFVWVKQIGGPANDNPTALFLDPSNNMYVSGIFSSTVDFDPGPATSNLASAGSSDAFILKFSRCQVTGTDIINSCDPHTWINGVEYTASNYTATYAIPGSAVNGCDSVVTLNLTIGDNQSPMPNLVSLPDLTATCAATSLTAPTATDNCAGSITATHNVTLPITAQGTTVVTWTYDDGNGNTSTQTQNVVIDDNTAPVPNAATLSDINVQCSVNLLTVPTATDNCAGSITATHNVTLPITTQGTTVVTWTYGDGNGNTSTQVQNIIISPIIETVSVNGITLSSNQNGAIYQWVDCINNNTPISGATSQMFTPVENGSYAAVITMNSCTETSGCVSITTVGVGEVDLYNWKVYPNPAREKMTIVIDKAERILVKDVSGKIVAEQQLQTGSNQLVIEGLSSGMYFIQAKTGTENVRFVKE
jgi:hypothetical protein